MLTGGFLSQAHAQSPHTLLLFGDSIIAGYGLSEDDTLTAQLQAYLDQKKLNVNIVNGGVSGDTTSAGVSRLPWTLKRHKPDIVFLALGGNDVLRGLPPSMAKQNLEIMLKTLQDNGVQVILSEVLAPANLGQEYSQELSNAFKDLAKRFNVPLYPFLLEDIFATPELMLRDGIHPSAAGVKAMTQRLGDYLLRMLSNA